MQAHVTQQSYAASSAYCPQRFVDVLTHRLQQLGDALVRVLAPQDTLHVQTYDRSGQKRWVVSDRITQARHEFTSEAALRTWLEKRYYE